LIGQISKNQNLKKKEKEEVKRKREKMASINRSNEI